MDARNGAVEAHNGAAEAHNGAVEAKNGAVEAHSGAAESLKVSVADPHTLLRIRLRKYYWNLDPRTSEKSDPHRTEKGINVMLIPQHEIII